MKIRLFTPGPLTTSDGVRAALNRDWGSREADFIALTKAVRTELVTIAGGDERHTCVPLQGSGTYAVEAALDTFCPRDRKTLVLVNGAYGHRAVEILKRLGIPHVVAETSETQAVDAAAVGAALAADAGIAAVFLVHCETTTGILNPLDAVAALTAARGVTLLADTMSSFGCIDVGPTLRHGAVVIASSNKGLQGVPGVGFVIAAREAIAAAAGRARSLTLDVHAQWAEFEKSGQWRFTPPVQVVAALDAALRELAREGGVAARYRRYAANRDLIVARLAKLDLHPVIAAEVQAPVIITFPLPDWMQNRFADLHKSLAAKGLIIYPGKLTHQPTFRIGCIGALTLKDMNDLADALEATLREQS